jgi:hypothetical protein
VYDPADCRSTTGDTGKSDSLPLKQYGGGGLMARPDLTIESVLANRMRISPATTNRLWRILLVLGVVYALAMVVYPTLRLLDGSGDFLAFHKTARTFLDTGQITTEHGVRNYLPFFVLFMAPFGLLPAWLACVLFNLLSISLLVLCLVMIDRWLLPVRRGGGLVRIAVPTLLALPFITAGLVLGQVIVVVLFLITLGWFLFEQKRDTPAGVCFALAALIKAFPAIVLLYVLLKRRWRVFAAAVAALVVFGALEPTVALGPQRAWGLHKQYWQRVVVGNSSLAMIEADKHRLLRFNNESLAVVVRRLLRQTDAAPKPPPLYVNVVDWPPAAAQAAYLLLAGVTLAGAVLVARRRSDRLPQQRLRFEFAMFVLVGLMLSPLVWVRYLTVALYPLCLLTVKLVEDGDAGRPNRAGLLVWIAWIVSIPLLASPWCRAVGVHMWVVALLAVVMAREALRTEAGPIEV